ncbi:MAG: transporter substrate-binding domain-containing protein [Clostridiales bacterium]|nr:transporter substrate-binding domain-containing protein [Clostridiales bacterium]
MKKIVTLILAVVMSIACLGLTACGQKTLVKVLDVELTNEQYAIAVNKQNTTLLEQINTAMRELKEDGTYAEIYAKYTAADYETKEADYAMTCLTEFTDPATQFAIATSADFPPFENKIGSKFVGLDIEFASKIAEKLGKTLVVLNMDFMAAEVYAQTNENVVSMAGLTVNDDRLSKMNFTDSYIDATQVLIVREGDTTFDSILNDETLSADQKSAAVIDLINSMEAPKIGAQNGTTGYNYAKGNQAFEYDGFANAIVSGYTSGALAVQDLVNGNIDMVILDKLPAKQIASNMNK